MNEENKKQIEEEKRKILEKMKKAGIDTSEPEKRQKEREEIEKQEKELEATEAPVNTLTSEGMKAYKETLERISNKASNFAEILFFITKNVSYYFVTLEASILTFTQPAFAYGSPEEKREALKKYIENKEILLPDILREYNRTREEANEVLKEEEPEKAELLEKSFEEEAKTLQEIFLKEGKTKDTLNKNYLKLLMQELNIPEKEGEAPKEKAPEANILTKSFLIPDNKLFNELAKLKAGQATAIDLQIMNDKKSEITLTINNESLTEALEPFEKDILARCYSLKKYNSIITPELIYKEYTGKDLKINNIGVKFYNDIVEAIDKLRKTGIKIEIQSPELQQKLNIEKRTLEATSLLPSIKQEDIYKVSEKEGAKVIQYKTQYILQENPILSIVNEKINQTKSIDRKFLAPLAETGINKERVVIFNYFAKRVDHIKAAKEGKTKKSYKDINKIAYETFFEDTKLLLNIPEAQQKTYKARYKNYVEEMLKEWKKSSLIKSFREYTKPNKKRAEGIEIIL